MRIVYSWLVLDIPDRIVCFIYKKNSLQFLDPLTVKCGLLPLFLDMYWISSLVKCIPLCGLNLKSLWVRIVSLSKRTHGAFSRHSIFFSPFHTLPIIIILIERWRERERKHLLSVPLNGTVREPLCWLSRPCIRANLHSITWLCIHIYIYLLYIYIYIYLFIYILVLSNDKNI